MVMERWGLTYSLGSIAEDDGDVVTAAHFGREVGNEWRAAGWQAGRPDKAGDRAGVLVGTSSGDSEAWGNNDDERPFFSRDKRLPASSYIKRPLAAQTASCSC